jgi:hypothetical protein
MSSNDGVPSSRKKRFGEHTFKDPTATHALAQRVKLDVALEKEQEEKERTRDSDRASSVTRATVVEGPDGIPQLADLPEDAPQTVRWDVEEDVEVEEEPPPAKRNP